MDQPVRLLRDFEAIEAVIKEHLAEKGTQRRREEVTAHLLEMVKGGNPKIG